MDFDFIFQPVQAKLYQAYEFGKATKIGFGGSRGGAKSYTADIVTILRRYKYPGTNGLFIMKVYQDMLDIHLNPLFEKFPELNKCFNKQQMILHLPQSGGSYIRFLSGDSLNEFQQRKGRGFADVVVDQSELFGQEELEFLTTINRSTDLSITPKMLLCFNPGGASHSYHKRIFIEKNFENNEEPSDFEFVQTFGWDNAYWSQKALIQDGLTISDYHTWDNDKRFNYFITRSDYGKTLNRLPDTKRKAELLGDFDIFEGMFFSEFRRDIHLVKNQPIIRQWNTIGGLDYGNITVLEILQRDYEGSIIAIDECYLPDYDSPTPRANAIADFLIERELWNLMIIYDTDMEVSQLSNVGFDKTPIEIFRQVFKQRMGDKAPTMLVVNKTSLDRNKGYRAVTNEAIKALLHVSTNSEGQRTTKLFFNDKCQHLIKEVTELIYDPANPNGLDYLNKGSNKPHCIDGFKHGYMNLYTPVNHVKKAEEEAAKIQMTPYPHMMRKNNQPSDKQLRF